jgi:Sulfotransferase domain
MKQRLSGFETEEGRLKGLDYQPQSPNEVIITTSPKAGTTWMQQICHQLRAASNGGDMNFEEIGQVVPWLELAHDLQQDLSAPQYGEDRGMPRIFKTHAWQGHCPSGCKTIVVLRDPMDVAASFYKFFENWFFDAGSLSVEAFCHEFWLARGVPTSRMNNASYFVHLTSWYSCRDRPDVLVVCFEDLKDDLKGQVERVAKFISNDKHNFCQHEVIQSAVERSSFAFMKEHSYMFDEKLTKLGRNEACGLPKDAGMQDTKLNRGKAGTGKAKLSDELQQAIQQKWKDVVEPVTGCTTYNELRLALGREAQF